LLSYESKLNSYFTNSPMSKQTVIPNVSPTMCNDVVNF